MKISELIQSHAQVAQQVLQTQLHNKLPLLENPLRIYSESWFALFAHAKQLSDSEKKLLCEADQELLQTDIGEFGEYEGAQVPLDVILEAPDTLSEAEYKGKQVELNKPKRGGPKKYYVYVKDPKTDQVKRVTFGSTELSVKIQDPKRRAAFAARHRCADTKDRTSARYWACRLPRFSKSLGLSPVNAQWW